MAVRRNTLPPDSTVADLLERCGNVPPHRIRVRPAPGAATEQDVLRIQAREDRLYELVDGVLVEKTVGLQESCLAVELTRLVGNFVARHRLGIVAGADGTLRILPRMVRIPDMSFISWARLPERAYPAEPIPDLAPDLAVEVLSKDNTKQEMARKLKDYFLAGVELVWYVDPRKRTVTAYTAPDEPRRYGEADTLDGGTVLPGFRLPLAELFAAVRPARRRGRRANGS
jgi:Uma2 family endonuclease